MLQDLTHQYSPSKDNQRFCWLVPVVSHEGVVAIFNQNTNF